MIYIYMTEVDTAVETDYVVIMLPVNVVQ